MWKTLRGRLTYANVAATLALLIALGLGSATAAKLITGADVRDNSLTGRDVRDGSLASVDITNRTLRAKDLHSSLRQLIEDPGSFVVRYAATSQTEAPPGTYTPSTSAECESEERATGGGVAAPQEIPGQIENAAVQVSRPIDANSAGEDPAPIVEEPTAWFGRVRYTLLSDGPAPGPQVWVICVSSSP